MSTADFRFIKPIAITDAMLTSSTVQEAVAATYAGGTTYALGDRVGLAPSYGTAQITYESLQAGNIGHSLPVPPAATTAWWKEVGTVYPVYAQGGETWAIRTSAADNYWQDVAYGNGLFVAVAASGTGNRVMTSPDGITWTIRTSAADNAWMSVAYGNSIFVAVAQTGTGNRVMTSPDGITWTIRTSAADNSWQDVVYGNDLFVAVAASGTGNRVMTSPDGITWTIRTSAADKSWWAIAYGNELFVAINASSNNEIMTSPDGITWTLRTSAALRYWSDVVYGNGLFVAVAISGGVTGTGNVMTSPDGITWTNRVGIAFREWSGVEYGGGLFVAVASNGTGNQVMTSPDGITWTSHTSPADNSWMGVAYGNDVFVAVAQSGTGNRAMTAPSFTCGLGGIVSNIGADIHELYESLVAENAYPLTNTAKWLPLGATNRWKMFDEIAASQTSNVGSLEVVLTPGTLINSAVFANLAGVSVRLQQSVSGYDRTVLLNKHEVLDWYDWFYEPIITRDEAAFMDVPPYAASSLTVTIDGGIGTASCGVAVFGQASYIGTTQWGLSRGINDYSHITEDQWGGLVLTPGNYSKLMNVDVHVPAGYESQVVHLLTSIRATAVMFVASEEHDSAVVYGTLGRGWNVPFDIAGGVARLEIRGLV